MKLCRFELATDPGNIHTGFLHGSKVYETDGADAAAVHEWSDLVPLTPIGRPPSIRLFSAGDGTGFAEDVGLPFQYLNPSSMIAPSRILSAPAFTDLLDIKPCLAAVVASEGFCVSPEQASEMILGYTVANCFVARDQGPEHKARAHDVAVACGPFVTTPDELADAMLMDEHGEMLQLRGMVRVNSIDTGPIDLTTLAVSLSGLISYASQSCPLAAGDLVLCGPLWESDGPLGLESGDEVQVFIDRLGTLVTRIG